MRNRRPFKTGDKIAFSANGVEGIVIRNCGPAVNTLTGNDVIEWREILGDYLDSVCIHDSELIEMLDAVPSLEAIDFSDGSFVNVLPNVSRTGVGRAAVAGPPEADGTVGVIFPGSRRVSWVPLHAVRQ